MNRCDECGKFRAWDQLVSVEIISMDIIGEIQQEEYWTCLSCRLRYSTPAKEQAQ